MIVAVFADGPEPPAPLELPAGTTVIAADGGAGHALAQGVAVDLVVGDLDSVSPETLEALGCRVERYPADKDASDLALALDAALALAPERIVVAGGGGGRLDQLTGELLLLGAEALAGVTVDAQLGPAAVHVIRAERELLGAPGELVSLFALHGPATGVVAEGVRYPLAGATLEPGSTLGLSNVFAAERARVAVGGGVVLAVRPSGSALAAGPDRRR